MSNFDKLFFTLGEDEFAITKEFVVKIELLNSRYITEDISFNPIVGIVSHFGLNAPLIDIRFEYDLEAIKYDISTQSIVINFNGTVFGIIADTISDSPTADIYKTIDLGDVIRNDPYLLQDGFEEEEALRAIEEAIVVTEDHHLEELESNEELLLHPIDSFSINNEEPKLPPINNEVIEDLEDAKYLSQDTVVNKKPTREITSRFKKLYIGELLEEADLMGVEISKNMSRDDIIAALESSENC
jgi:chemotaxis signal transduction protein